MALASIQRVSGLAPIEGADAIEVATIQGWKTVVKKGEFKIGDKCVFCEIDSILPARPEFAFLEKVHYRIKTIRLRGQISQGICFPISILGNISETPEDMDVSHIMGVTKYEKPEPGFNANSTRGGKIKTFPSYVPQTDEVRIQAKAASLIKELTGLPCYFTTKIDGTSSTFANKDGDMLVCSRTQTKVEHPEKKIESVYWNIAYKYDLLNKLGKAHGYAVQGEIAGPGIQGNKLKLSSPELFVFNVWNIREGTYLDFDNFMRFCCRYELPTVPIDAIDVKFDFTLEQLLEMAKGKYKGTNNHREGIVIRPMIEKYSITLKGRLSTKVINNEFLLSGGD